jgi:hypothetical protein
MIDIESVVPIFIDSGSKKGLTIIANYNQGVNTFEVRSVTGEVLTAFVDNGGFQPAQLTDDKALNNTFYYSLTQNSLCYKTESGDVVIVGSLEGVPGPQGVPGSQGIQGVPGVGVPTGGNEGEFLIKNTSINSGTSSNRLAIKSGSTTVYTNSYNHGGNLWIEKTLDTNPDTGLPWTTTGINGTTIGDVEANSIKMRIMWAGASVVYKEAIISPSSSEPLIFLI